MPCLETTQLRAQPTETGPNCQNAGVSGEDRISSVAKKNMFKSVKNINYWDIPNHLSWWHFKIIFIFLNFVLRKILMHLLCYFFWRDMNNIYSFQIKYPWLDQRNDTTHV